MKTRLFAIALVSALSGAVGGCGGGRATPRPVVVVSMNTDAQSEMQRLQERWEARPIENPELLQAQLALFVKKYPNDGAAPLAVVYMIWIELDLGQIQRAEADLAKVSGLPAGSTRDLATVARARAYRLRGDADKAMELLRPLVGKIIDPADRELFLREIALAAIDARYDYEAIAYMDSWLRGVAEDDRDRVATDVSKALEGIPRAVLEPAYRAMRARGAQSGYSIEIQKLVAARLGKIAVDENDAALARWLLAPTDNASTATAETDPSLGELATSRRGLHAVYGRMIGLLLTASTAETRDRSADVARGVAWALGLPRPPGSPDEVRLVTRSDGGDVKQTEAALEEMAGEGVSVVVAGMDTASADRALKWCQTHGLAVLLLSPATEAPSAPGLLLGDARANELPLLADALASRGVTKVGLVSSAEGDRAIEVGAIDKRSGLELTSEASCDAKATTAGLSRFPLAAWASAGTRAWVISGPAPCARDVIAETALVPQARAVAFTLDAADAIDAARVLAKRPNAPVVLTTAAGHMPLLTPKPEDADDVDMRAYAVKYRARPSWWTALGRDAALLARNAVAPLPLDGASDEKIVEQRRTIVERGLLGTRTKLWTTEAEGFASSRTMGRTYRVVPIQ